VFAGCCFKNCFCFEQRTVRKVEELKKPQEKKKTPFRLHLILEESIDSLFIVLVLKESDHEG